MKEIESLKKSFQPIASTPKSGGFEEVAKNSDFINLNPVDIALGKIKKSWSDIQGQDKKLEQKFVGGDLI